MRSSWENRHRGYEESLDRFSNIPDEVVHEILCFLPIKDIARTSLVSTRFRELCVSVPDLIFDFGSHDLLKLTNWTDWFLTLRNGAKLRRFLLKNNIFLCHEDIVRVCNWINNTTVNCKTEELDLSFRMPEKECVSLPLSTFVRTIRLNLYHGILKLPSGRFSSLEVLDIKGIRLAQNLSEDWVSSLFPVIKTLNLKHIDVKNLNITSSSLEWLSIKYCDIHKLVVSAERLHTLCVEPSAMGDDWLFRIYAPNLQNISWNTDNHYSFQGSFMCLKSVNIDAPRLVFLQFLNHAKSLTLRSSIVDLPFTQHSLGLGFMLDKVQNLDLQVSYCKKNHIMPALASFFGRLPNLKTLTMSWSDLYYFGRDESNNLSCDFDMEYWDSKYVAFIHQLKEVKIEIHRWGLEVGLIKYFIKHAKALDMMTVTFSRNINICRSMLIRKSLSEFYETFPNATLDLVLK